MCQWNITDKFAMKKIFMLIAFAGLFSLGVSAESMCSITGNVQPSMTSESGGLKVSCKNYNSYMVNVQITANVCDQFGNCCEKSAFLVMKGEEEKSATLKTCNGKTGDVDKSGVRISVTKCE